MQVVVGVAVHNGWMELVRLGFGPDPRILGRRRVELRREGVPDNPFHHEGLVLPLSETERLVDLARQTIEDLATAALRPDPPDAIVLEASPYPELPGSVAEVLASYPLTCAADGMLYRETVARCAQALGIGVRRYPRRADLLERAATARGSTRDELDALLGRFGREVGVPWRKEHRLAAAAALWVQAA